MSNDLKYIDELFKEKLNDKSVASTQVELDRTSKLIMRFNFFHFSFNTFNIYYSILIILLAISSAFYFGINNNKRTDYLKTVELAKPEIFYRDIIIPVDTIDIEPIMLVKTNKIQNTTIVKETDLVEDDKVIEKTAPVDSLITKDKDINSLKDTMVIYKRVIIADTVRTIITKKYRPNKKGKKD